MLPLFCLFGKLIRAGEINSGALKLKTCLTLEFLAIIRILVV